MQEFDHAPTAHHLLKSVPVKAFPAPFWFLPLSKSAGFAPRHLGTQQHWPKQKHLPKIKHEEIDPFI